MSNPALEAILARLYTDARFRAEFFSDRRRTADGAGLSRVEVEALMVIDAFALELAARTFERKRARRALASASSNHADALRESQKSRVGAQRRELRIDIHEHDLRRMLVGSALQMRERLDGFVQCGKNLGHIVWQHVLRRRVGLEPLHDRQRRLPVAANRRDVRVERACL